MLQIRKKFFTGLADDAVMGLVKAKVHDHANLPIVSLNLKMAKTFLGGGIFNFCESNMRFC